ncbi:MAG: hypothetical protein ABJG78_15920 [Cyclobacteriaceae bacterium]
MRLINKISLLFCFAFAANSAFAEHYGYIQPSQEGEKRQITEGIDHSEGLEGGTEPIEDSESDEPQATEQQSVDSTEDTSVNKHNFIFYFLYKLKYNENQEVQEIF